MFYSKFLLTLFCIPFFFPVELEKKVVLDDKVEILMPKGWKPMSDELIRIKYPGARPPKLVYSDNTGAISLAFNHTESKATKEVLDKYAEVLKQSLEKAYPDAVWEESGMKEINGKKVGFFRVITETPNDRIYNYMLFTDLDNKLLICSFNCVEKRLKEWRPVAQEIMESIRFKP
jgi:hypothetical protein